jgi:glycosyltransferase involved in cell wall biosynthesis
MVGTVTEEKNPLLWIEIARKVVTETFEKPVVFRWIGEGPLKAECKRQIAEYALENQVVFAGFDPLPSTHYLASDIYLHVSSVETLSSAAIDSARFGVPGVISATGGFPEIVSDGVTGFVVDSQDPDDFAGKISFLLRGSKLRQKMGDKARLHYASKFSEEAWNSSLRNLLNR